jgi:hypothetical protein
MTTSKLFLIADIDRNVMTMNPDQISTIGSPDKDPEGITTNKVTMSSGEEYDIPVQLLIAMINQAEIQVFDLISPPKDMTEASDVNDTEYTDDEGFEGEEVVELQPYPDMTLDPNEPLDDEELTAGEESDYNPADNESTVTVLEGSEAYADVSIRAEA